MIKAIVFDCFGVLTTDLWREFCADLPDGPVLQTARQLNHDHDAGNISRDTFLREIQEVTGRQPQEVELLLDYEINKNTRLLEYIGELKKEYKIGLLSNVATSWIRERFLSRQEQGLFDAMVFSFEVSMTKPDPRIFELVCQRLGVMPEETVMVDDIARYCDAAKSVGMSAVTYVSYTQLRNDIKKLTSEKSHS